MFDLIRLGKHVEEHPLCRIAQAEVYWVREEIISEDCRTLISTRFQISYHTIKVYT